MTAVVDDPLISRHGDQPDAAAARVESPIARAVSGVSAGVRRRRHRRPHRRRWWPLSEVLTTDRLRVMFDAASAETDSRVAVAQQLAATLSHVVIGRVVPLLSLEGARVGHRIGEPLGARRLRRGDRLGRRLRPNAARASATPTSTATQDCAAPHPARDRIVALPSEAALTTWVAHRSHRALAPLFDKLFEVSDGCTARARDVAHRRNRRGERRHPGAAARGVE